MTRGRRGNGEGTITQRKNGTWETKITLEDGKRKSIYGKTRKEVQEKLKIALREQQQGTLVTAPQQKLEDFLNKWLEDTQKHGVRPRAYEKYESIVRLHINPVLGRHFLHKLTPQMVQTFFKKKLDEGLAPKSIAVFRTVLHKALDTAVSWGLIARNVCDVVSPPRVEEYEPVMLTIEQVRSLQKAMQGHRLEVLYTLTLATAMRRGEIMALKWHDIDFKQGVLYVRHILTRVPTILKQEGQKSTFVEAETKTRRSRRNIVVAPFALKALEQHRERQKEIKAKAGPLWKENDYVFCTSVGTHLHPSKDMLDPLKKIASQAGLPPLRFHDLRHATATLLLSEGVHPKIVQEILGHSQISMTLDVYSHVLPNMQRDAMDKLNNLLRDREDGEAE